MINNLSILATLVLIAFVVLRAIALDQTIPWFGSRTPVDRSWENLLDRRD